MNHRSSIRLGQALLALGLAAAGAHAAAQANLLVNGSFEAGDFVPNAKGVQDIGFGPPYPITGWTTFVGEVFWIGNGNAYGLTASDGSLHMSLYDPFRPLVGVGSVQQTVASTPGTVYEVSFDLGRAAGFPGPVGVQVQAAGYAANFLASGMAAMNWEHHSWRFTANDTYTVIAFVGQFGPGYVMGDEGYIGLDNAALRVAAVPEPGALALWLAALPLLGLQLRRRLRPAF
jgi:Protein of unknown function (DUF642)